MSALDRQAPLAIPAQDAGAVEGAQIPHHHPAQVEALRGVLVPALGHVDARPGLFQQAVVGAVDVDRGGELMLRQGAQMRRIGVLLPGDEGGLLRHQGRAW